MQKYLVLLSLILSVTGEAPYQASGWRPSGPAFELPQRGTEAPQQYLPPLDPRNPRTNIDADDDVSVQGLPVPEPVPQFNVSPVSGQQYVGPAFRKDLQGLDERYRQNQYQQQQQKLRELARQQQEYSAPASIQPQANKPSPVPRQFVPRTTIQPTTTADQRSTTESLNTGETFDDQKPRNNLTNDKVSVEISQQKIQEYPPELFLGPLAQVRLQSVRNPGQQFAQLVYQPSLQELNQKQTKAPAFDGVANLGLVQSILADQQPSAALLASRNPNPHFVLISSANQDLNQYQQLGQQYRLQPVLLPAQLNQYDQTQKKPEVRDVEKVEDDKEEATKQDQPRLAGQPQFVPQPQGQQFVPQQFVPQQQQFVPQQQQFVPQQQQFVPQQQQFVSQQQQFVPQQQQFVPQQQPFVPQEQLFMQQQQQQFVPQQQQQFGQQQQQFVPQQQQLVPQQQQFVVEQPQVYQPQEIQYQVQPAQYQPPDQAQLNYQPTNEDINLYFQQQQLLLQQQQQQLLVQQQQVFQRQNQAQGIQSELGDGQQNNLDQGKDGAEDNQDGGQVATAVATAFGDRKSPRVVPQYGVPLPKTQSTTEDSDEQAATTEASVVAEATAISRGGKRKSAKLRTRRVRPIFGVDKSGHLVQLMQEQE